MDKLNFSIPTSEFIEEKFQMVLDEISKLKKDLCGHSNKKNKYYRNKDLMEHFGLAENTIISYREKGYIPYTKIGSIYYYPVEELEKKLKSNSNY